MTLLSAIMTQNLVLDIGHFCSTGSQNRTKLTLQGHRKEYQYCSGPAGNQTHFSQAQGHTSCNRPFLDIGCRQLVSICCPCPLFVPNQGPTLTRTLSGVPSAGPRLRPQTVLHGIQIHQCWSTLLIGKTLSPEAATSLPWQHLTWISR